MSTEKLNRMLEFIIMPDNGGHCIYRLIDSSENVVYVGHTANLESRIYSHLANGKDFSFFDYALCSKEDAKVAERDAIIKHNPKLNISLPVTPEYKTSGQARRMIDECVMKKLSATACELTENLPVVFDRPKSNNSNHTYIKTSDIESAIRKIELSQFIALGED